MRVSLFFLHLSLLLSSLCSFQTTIFQNINKKSPNENVIVSPLSIFQILSLTANGAKSSTLDGMLKALGEDSVKRLNAINREIIDAEKDVKTVEVTNAVMTRFLPLLPFVSAAKEYAASLQPLTTVGEVNNWCKAKTHGKINKILDRLDANTAMILLNAVYFKGKWTKPFEKDDTVEKDFYNFGANPVKVEMMRMKGKMAYFEDSTVQVLKKDYVDDNISAVFILPNKAVNINTFIAKITDERLEEYYSKLKNVKVELEVPKVELEFSGDLDEILRSLGMQEAYSDNADFGKMTNNNDIRINKVIHKTYLKVDEDGTEAAAVTAVVMNFKSMAPREEIVYKMHINRPFVLLLLDEKLPKKYNLLFMAKVEKL